MQAFLVHRKAHERHWKRKKRCRDCSLMLPAVPAARLLSQHQPVCVARRQQSVASVMCAAVAPRRPASASGPGTDASDASLPMAAPALVPASAEGRDQDEVEPESAGWPPVTDQAARAGRGGLRTVTDSESGTTVTTAYPEPVVANDIRDSNGDHDGPGDGSIDGDDASHSGWHWQDDDDADAGDDHDDSMNSETDGSGSDGACDSRPLNVTVNTLRS